MDVAPQFPSLSFAPCHGRLSGTLDRFQQIPKVAAISRSQRELFATAWERFLTVPTRFVLTNNFLFSFIKMFKYEKFKI
jgi:hypothetical protein